MLIFLHGIIGWIISVTSSMLKLSWNFEALVSNSGYTPERLVYCLKYDQIISTYNRKFSNCYHQVKY